MRALLINPEELIVLGLVLVPDATHYFAIGEPTKSWQSLAGFIVAALDDLAATRPATNNGRPVDTTLVIPCSDTLAVRSVEAGPHEIRVQLEWCGIERAIVYFLHDFGKEWSPEVSDVNVVIDLGPHTTPMGKYADHIAPALAPRATLLATEDAYDARWYPFFPRVEKPAPPRPDVAAEFYGNPVWRIQCLCSLEPTKYRVSEENASEVT